MMSEQDEFQPPIDMAQTPADSPSKEDYVRLALENLRTTSRTAKGVVDVSASAGKAQEMQVLSEQEAADRALVNFQEAMSRLYEQRGRAFERPEDVRAFVEAIAKEINQGITKEGVLIRSHNSPKYPYTKVEHLAQAMKQFYEEFFARLQDPSEDPERLAGWIEYRIDLTDHFFADGCGKTAKAISGWALMRFGRRLPRYRSRAELYEHAPMRVRGANPEVEQQEFERWIHYYKSLFSSR